MSALGAEARRLARGQTQAVLSTLSLRIEGYPFGSVAPYILDHAGRPVILISELAEHTRNLHNDPRCSLLVQPFSADMQATGRVTLLGRAERLPEKDRLGPRYLRHHPQAEGYLAMHDFAFWRIEPVRIRYIGGFGRVHWIEAESYLLPEGPLAGQEADILQHMNADHVHNLIAYCRHVHGVEVDQAEMVGIDPDGFDVRAHGHLLRFDFPAPVTDAVEARTALVEHARQCRA